MKMLCSLAVLPFVALCSVGASHSSCSSRDGDSAPTQKKLFPANFDFGVSVAAYQIEGAWNASGKSDSIWDVFCRQPGKIKDNSTGNDACKSYEYYQRDTQMLQYLGVDFYRLSISWPRILPKGFSNEINQEGIDHYNDVINDLLKNNIDPVVTIYHWDIPQSLQDLGGWANPLIVEWLEDYARVLFENFGDRVKTWISINEPKQFGWGYSKDEFAPGVNAHGIGDYLIARHAVLAHARIWHLYDKEFRQKQKGNVGITIAADASEPLTDSWEDHQAAEDQMLFDVGLYAHPIFSATGGFPPRVVQLVAEKSKQQGYPRSRLQDFTDEEREYCKGTGDFFGLNHYSTRYYTRRTYKPGKDIPSMEDDMGVVGSFLDYPRTASEHFAVVPHGIRVALNWIKDSYNNPPILITENGIATQKELKDPERIDFLLKYLSNVLDAINEDQVNVFGYSAWSLMDDFEWADGYGPKFGLFDVDFNDEARKRQARLSAIWYRDLIATKILDPDYTPAFKQIEF